MTDVRRFLAASSLICWRPKLVLCHQNFESPWVIVFIIILFQQSEFCDYVFLLFIHFNTTRIFLDHPLMLWTMSLPSNMISHTLSLRQMFELSWKISYISLKLLKRLKLLSCTLLVIHRCAAGHQWACWSAASCVLTGRWSSHRLWL